MFTVQPTLLIGPSDWSAGVMPKEQFDKRIEALWRAHPEAPCAIIYGDRCHHAELAYLTNFVPKLEAAVALLFRTGEHEIHVGGGPNMVGAARPLTWIRELKPLRGAEAIGRRAAESRTALPGVPLLIGGDYMSTALHQGLVEAIGEPPVDATAQVWTLMRRSNSNYERLANYNACVALNAAVNEMVRAWKADASATDVILAGESVANDCGAQDVRTLFSLNGGRTLVPFTTPIDRAIDPLQIYIAVRRCNYWIEGFFMLSERPQPAAKKADELLRLAVAAIKAGTRPADVEKMIAARMKRYHYHPVTAGALVSRIGIALEEPPYTNAVTPFEASEACSVRVGITDKAENHAIVSAMIRVRDQGLDVFWSGTPEPIRGSQP